MQLPVTVELKGIRVLTSKQLAECYESTPVRIKQNFNENRNRFVDGKHYISLTGDELKEFKKQVGIPTWLQIELLTYISGQKKVPCFMQNL